MSTMREHGSGRFGPVKLLSTPTPSWFGVVVVLWFGLWIGASSSTEGAVIAGVVATVAIILCETAIRVVRRSTRHR